MKILCDLFCDFLFIVAVIYMILRLPDFYYYTYFLKIGCCLVFAFELIMHLCLMFIIELYTEADSLKEPGISDNITQFL